MIRSLNLSKTHQRIFTSSIENPLAITSCIWHRSTRRCLASTAAAAADDSDGGGGGGGGGEASEARKTTLYDFHVSHQGKMVPFAGFLLPVQYGNEGIAKSHQHTRRQASLFDVSHMMQSQVRGKDRMEFLESVTTADLDKIEDNWATLTLFTDPRTGGILDDLIITKTALGYCNVVSNAGRRREDQALLLEAQEEFRAKGKEVEILFLDPDVRALVALQGPSAIDVLHPLTDVDLSHLYFMSSTLATVAGVKRCRITRCGYTGEDGVEISFPAEDAPKLVEAIMQSDQVKLAGLGARDSLRLEAGMCLYGNDIDHTTTPIEAGLAWLIGKRRREQADFPGADIILNQLRAGPARRRVGLRSTGPPARAHARIFAAAAGGEAEEAVGEVTSGCPSPTLGGNVAMGYVKAEHAKPGTKLRLQVRDKFVDAVVTKLPFVPAKYYVPPK